MDDHRRGFTRAGPVAVVVLPGEIDVGNAGQVLAEPCSAALARGVRVVVADLSGTRFCDSSGVKALTLAHRRAAESGTELRLAVRSAMVRRVFEVVGLGTLMPVYDGMESALPAARGGAAGRSGTGRHLSARRG